jgi:CRISPR-associated endonuclease/helicase Cas3
MRETAERLTRRPLFHWQSRLLVDHLSKGDIPDAVDIPTGLGKTTVMVLWLAALAHGAPLPRRLFYVVDRRAVVDQATVVAETVAKLLGNGVDALADDGPVDAVIAACRRGLGLGPRQRLPVSTLRGQYADNRAWLADPSCPSIVVGTVDMLGSRLLFSGYGVSPRMRPVHAGLLGADALFMIDEAHLVPPFEALMRQIQEMRRQQDTPCVPPFRVMSLSATGRTRSPHVFSLRREDWKDDRAARLRLQARKRVILKKTVPAADLAAALARQAWLLGKPDNAAVLVFCDRRKDAQDVCQLLKKQLRDTFGDDADTPELLVGERRVRERKQLVEKAVFKRFLPERHDDKKSPKAHPRPAFLIATSAGEVGVDLDPDHMVCDLVAWERMVQRFGRVNRRAKPARDAQIVIIPAEIDRKTNRKDGPDDDGEAAASLALLKDFIKDAWPRDADGWPDASPAQLHHLKSDKQFADILSKWETPEPLRPAFGRAEIDAWAMTSLDQHSGRPDPQHWLRGWVKDEAQTRVVWRQHFPLRAAGARDAWEDPQTRKDVIEFFEAAPPHLTEALDAPTARVVDVLRKRAGAWAARSRTDHSSTKAKDDPPHDPVLLIFSRSGQLVAAPYRAARLLREKPDAIHRLLANRTVIVDARLGGLDDDGLLSHAADRPVATLDGDESTWGINLTDTAGFQVRRVKVSADRAEDDAENALQSSWRAEHRWRAVPEDEEKDKAASAVLIVDAWRGKTNTCGEAYARGNPALGRFNQSLSEHIERMIECIEAIARRLNLAEPYVVMLRFVALMHDPGKARVVWQNAMGVPPDGGPYAKSKGRCVPKMLEIAGEIYRHEFGSLREALIHRELMKVSPELRPLALHLIAAHHGFARPVIAACDPDAPRTVCVPIARDAAIRFFDVQAKWGHWGLAWWESVVRMADWQASAQIDSACDEEKR